jgi:hypothetical protein
MNNFLMSFMDDWLMNLFNLLFVDNRPMFFMNHRLMNFMNNILMMLMNHILVVFMDHFSMRLLYNRNCSVRFYSWSYVMSFNKRLLLMTFNNAWLIMPNNSCCLCSDLHYWLLNCNLLDLLLDMRSLLNTNKLLLNTHYWDLLLNFLQIYNWNILLNVCVLRRSCCLLLISTLVWHSPASLCCSYLVLLLHPP